MTIRRFLAFSLLALLSTCGRVGGLARTEAVLAVSSDALDFGAVTEGQNKALAVKVDNTGRGSVPVTLSFSDGSSPDFALGDVPVRIEAGSSFTVTVTFTPHGAGEDTGALLIATGDASPISIALHGGPIAPALAFSPDPLDFKPMTLASETRTVKLRSVGTASMAVSGVALAAGGNPDFALVPVATPLAVLPGQDLSITVEYARSGATAEGTLEVTTDAVDGGVARLRLLPDPLPACTGTSRACYTADAGTLNKGACKAGSEACTSGYWSGVCQGEVTPAATDTCGNHVDDDCDGVVDQGCPVTDACARATTTAPDAYEPNNSDAQSRLASPPASQVSTYTYDLTLTPGDEDWFVYAIPTSGSNTNLRAEVLCLNWAGSGCSGAKEKVGLTLYYMDQTRTTLGLGPSIDGNNDGSTGRALVQNSGPINSGAGSQRWYVQVKATSPVCTNEAIDLTLQVKVTNT